MKDYLSAFIGKQGGEIPAHTTSDELTKLTKIPSQGPKEVFVNFVSTKGVGYSENQSAKVAERTSTGIPAKASTSLLTKPLPRESQKVEKWIKPKVWRLAPYWPACAEAARTSAVADTIEAADLLYVALALREGHPADEVCEMLRRCTPRASTSPDYCGAVIRRVSANPALFFTAELVSRYIAAHPFAWEVGLRSAQ